MLWGAILRMVEYLALSLTSIYQMPVTPPYLPDLKPKASLDTAKLPPVENYCHKVMENQCRWF